MNTICRQRLMICGIAAIALCLADANSTNAQDKDNFENKVLTTRDGWPLHITYFKPTGVEDKETPVVVMLHGKGGNRLVYGQSLAKKLQDRGFAVVTVDLRKHGESVPAGAGTADLNPRDYRPMALLDLEAVKGFLLEEHQAERLNMRKTAIVAADMSALVAMNYAALDWLKKPYSDAPTLAASTPRGQDIRAMVLLSPEGTLPGLEAAVKASATLRNPNFGIAFLLASSTGDRQDRGTTKKIHTQLMASTGAKNRVYLQSYKGAWRGTDMIGKRGINVDTLMVAFLERHLKDLSGPSDTWRDRKSRLSN